MGKIKGTTVKRYFILIILNVNSIKWSPMESSRLVVQGQRYQNIENTDYKELFKYRKYRI